MDGASVLLVDDDQGFLFRLKGRLEAYGFKVATATDGNGAVSRAEREVFDAVVLDVQMPGMDGETTLRKLLENNPKLNVIMLTGYANIERGVQALRNGAFDYLEKPADMGALLKRLRDAREKRLLLIEKENEQKIQDVLKGKSW